MKLYTLHNKQNLPITLDKAWDFISNPKNLTVITPTEMRFTTISGDEKAMFPGQIIHYSLKPILGIPMQWVTEITNMKHKEHFVDEQRFGPYAFWHHKHFLREIPGGVEMEDIIHYKIPMGILGQMVHPFLVKPNLDKIFAYRQKKLIELFGEYSLKQVNK
ncbi:SRPBCC family protein [Flavobacterium sp. GT3R68]|uniref:SRPBCC family protein n=1 Tax=Flavobacterium sp. GT3R68 TaxID=2594437 RepID=UPI000F88EB89|nr:SRPBCC family protein [Flavobacterium sp. GT3R68]RTY95041.1 cell division inhibitor [Flavobacterium sp. GSN2]TRW91847.1 SRPBCC family protein [Flavobacterium sp. GT3R68]